MTKDEAKTKWCPYTTLGAATESCIGDGCMAWRWHEINEYNKHGDAVGTRQLTEGYCGLAGTP